MTATEGGGLKRMDLKEINPYLHSLARFPCRPHFVITSNRERHLRWPGVGTLSG